MDQYVFTYQCGMLKMFSNFQQEISNIHFQYETDNTQLKVLREEYELDKLSGNGDTLRRSLSILRWVNENVFHNGNAVIEPYDSISILNHSYQKGKDAGVACFCLAIVLNECLLSIGIKSRIVHLYPANPYEFDSHVVVMTYIPELKSGSGWIQHIIVFVWTKIKLFLAHGRSE